MKFNMFFVLIAFSVMIVPISFAQANAQSEEILMTFPNAPGNLTAITNLPIILFWNASADPSSQTPITHYSIERSDNGGITWDVLSANIDITKPYNHLKAETITYTDSNVVIGNVYDYRVKAHNLAGESMPSNTSTGKAVLEPGAIKRNANGLIESNSDPNAEIYIESKILTDFEKNYVLTQDDVKEIFDLRWEIIKTENMLNNTDSDMRYSKIILKDTTQFFEPIFKKLKLSSMRMKTKNIIKIH